MLNLCCLQCAEALALCTFIVAEESKVRNYGPKVKLLLFKLCWKFRFSRNEQLLDILIPD